MKQEGGSRWGMVRKGGKMEECGEKWGEVVGSGEMGVREVRLPSAKVKYSTFSNEGYENEILNFKF